jgi:hypothetical protein
LPSAPSSVHGRVAILPPPPSEDVSRTEVTPKELAFARQNRFFFLAAPPSLDRGNERRMSQYLFVLEMKKLLGSLDSCLEKAVTDATTRKYEVDILLQCRLAPDMFPLVRQIQAVCDQAKYAVGRTTGKDIPSHPDTEKTVAELRARIALVKAYLDEFTAADFEGIAERTVTTPRWEGKRMTAPNYFAEHALPNFFFHLSMAYAILRHNGVPVGKRDYLGAITYV